MNLIARAFAALSLVVVLAIGASATVRAEEVSIKDFAGEYVGRSVTHNTESLEPRDLGVTIRGDDKAFTISWTTISRRADGRTSPKSYTIDFLATQRTGIYRSGMRRNQFGGRVPLDPLKGEPYVWARLHERTLTVHALHIKDDGGFEIQVYDRTLSDGGLRLRFARQDENGPLKELRGELKRIHQ